MTQSRSRPYAAGTPIGDFAPATKIFDSTPSSNTLFDSCQLGYSRSTGQPYIWTPSEGWQQLTTGGSGGVLSVPNGGTGVSTLTGLAYGNGTSAFTGIVPTVTSGSAGSPQVLNNRAGNITFTGINLAAGATVTLTNTNSSITAGTTQILWSMSGATTGAALTMQSVTPSTGSVAYVVTNGTGATTSTADITIQFLILN